MEKENKNQNNNIRQNTGNVMIIQQKILKKILVAQLIELEPQIAHKMKVEWRNGIEIKGTELKKVKEK